MAFLTRNEFTDRHNDGMDSIPPDMIDKALREGKREVKKLVSETVFNLVDAATMDAADTDTAETLRDAQDDFAYAAILPELSERIKDGRILLTARDETGNATSTYKKFSDLAGAIAHFRAKAVNTLEGYLVVVESEAVGGSYSQNVAVSYEW